MTSIGIVGAGAIGGTIAARLALAGADVTLYARGARHDRLRRDGLVLDGASGRVTARPRIAAPEAATVHDVLFLCVKAPALASILPLCRRAADARTRIVPLVNGVPFWYFADRAAPRPVSAVDPDGALLARWPAARIVGGIVYVRAEVRDDGGIASQGGERLVLGHVTAKPDVAIDDIAALLRDAGIDVAVSAAIRAELWTKVALNLATNPLSVASGATLDRMFGDPALLAVVRPILAETVATARALGVEPALGLDAMIALGRAAGPAMTSMAQDRRMRRPLELDAIGRSVLELAAAAGTPMPVAAAACALADWLARADGIGAGGDRPRAQAEGMAT